MNKSTLIDALAARTKLSKATSGKALDALVESLPRQSPQVTVAE